MLLSCAAAAPVLAGRPLATDDAVTADAKTCQIETWHERAGPDRAWVLAPACGVAATAPYVHDGRFATLSEVLKDGRMGNTSQLSAAELADLEAYLRSL